METSSFSQGAVLNISAVSRECSVERKVVENYFTILDDLLLAYRLPVFSKKAKRKLISHQKFYIFDVGVYRAIRPRGPLDAADEIGGSAIETLFLQEIVAVNAYFELGFTIYYWRTPTGNEVDFVLYGNRGLIAFEIKSSRTYSSKDAKGLRAFSKDYPLLIVISYTVAKKLFMIKLYRLNQFKNVFTNYLNFSTTQIREKF